MKKEAKGNESLIGRIYKDALAGDTSILDSIDIDMIQDIEAKNFYMALRKEFKKMITERKKFLNKYYPLKSLSDYNASKVEKLLAERFREKGYGNDAMHRTRKLWQDFVKTTNPHIKDVLPWVAALDFIVRSSAHTDFDNPIRLTQKLVAQEFGITFGQINRCYRSINSSVDTGHYFSHFDNIETLHRLVKSIFKITKRFRKTRDPIEIEMIKADEAWFDRIYKYSLEMRSRRKHINARGRIL
ncbi:MAG: hypothetical protein AB1390_09815 [Nitrospirota bacterium]